MTGWRDRNLAALTTLFTDSANTIQTAAPRDGILVTTARSGATVLDWHGRALDSRRDPVQAASVAAADVASDVVVVL